jgi:hypothetical protein
MAAFGLAHYNRYALTGDESSRTRFLQVAEWFARAEDGRFTYTFDWIGIPAPWISCMAQGEGISVLTRAYSITGEDRYLTRAIQAAFPFACSVAEGGVRSVIDGQNDFLEEFPMRQPFHVLNGFLYALVGALDLIKLEPSVADDIGLSSLIATLERQWQRWDLGYWSAYDLHASKRARRNAATVSYHRLHVTQMRYLGTLLGSGPLLACADRWARYYHSPLRRVRALYDKIQFRLEEPAAR